MDSVIEVSIVNLKQDETSMNELVIDLKNIASEIEVIMAELNCVWSGDSQKVFMSKYETDRQEIKDMLEDISVAVELLEKAKDVYSKCEEHIYQAVSAVQI